MKTVTTLSERWYNLHWDGIVVHFNEIALKGGNRKRFIERLQFNFQRLFRDDAVKVSAYHDRLLIRADSKRIQDIHTRAASVFGVNYAAPVRILEYGFEPLRDAALETYQKVAVPGDTFALRVKRAFKQFPMTSHEIEFQAGGHVKQTTGATVCLDNPAVCIRFRVNKDSIYQEGPPLAGPDGLPAGVSGKVLNLFSGGIDSPVAAWLSLRRGCSTDFIHYHTYPTSEQVEDTKIYPLIRQVIQPQGLRAKLFLVPYHAFELGLLSTKIPREYELVIFRRFMVRVANAVAYKNNYAALVTGDNLGQVASQTMGNLAAFDAASGLPVFRPLVMANKNDIIDIARRIGTFEKSIEPYKDCCSLVSSGPQTNPRMKTLKNLEAGMPIQEMTDTAIAEMTQHIIE
jgi:thiamine biosynthesis protein ThiI